MVNKRIKDLRKLKKLSQKEFGQSLNLSQNHISSIEKGIRDVTERTINDICRIYHVKKEWLLNGSGEIFEDILSSFDIQDNEVKEFTKMFTELDPETRKYISGLMKKTLEK